VAILALNVAILALHLFEFWRLKVAILALNVAILALNFASSGA
jgi:hypothetical protein